MKCGLTKDLPTFLTRHFYIDHPHVDLVQIHRADVLSIRPAERNENDDDRRFEQERIDCVLLIKIGRAHV